MPTDDETRKEIRAAMDTILKEETEKFKAAVHSRMMLEIGTHIGRAFATAFSDKFMAALLKGKAATPKKKKEHDHDALGGLAGPANVTKH